MATRRSALSPEVSEFLAAKKHPLGADIDAVREVVLRCGPSIQEEVKWNSVSFRNANDFFATVHLRSTKAVQVVLHTGVTKKATARTGIAIEDPAQLIEKWASKDRCIVTLGAGKTLEKNRKAFAALVTAWQRAV